jgi:hypothetical protein
MYQPSKGHQGQQNGLTSRILHLVTHFADLAVETSVILPEDGPLTDETCQSDTVLTKVVLMVNVYISRFFM